MRTRNNHDGPCERRAVTEYLEHEGLSVWTSWTINVTFVQWMMNGMYF